MKHRLEEKSRNHYKRDGKFKVWVKKRAGFGCDTKDQTTTRDEAEMVEQQASSSLQGFWRKVTGRASSGEVVWEEYYSAG